MAVTSPCTGICKLDDTSGWCLGCGRSGDEIAEWGMQAEIWRDRVWTQIPERLSQLGVAYRRLPWKTEDIRQFVARSCAENQGTWVMGVVGAVAEFSAPSDVHTDVTLQGFDLTARTLNGAMRMAIDDDVRALAFDTPIDGSRPRIVLAVKRERERLPVANGITDLGEDKGILLSDSGSRLFDLGLGRKEARFCIRVDDGISKEAIRHVLGSSFSDALPSIGAALVMESPTRVIETALGRIEVQGQIPAPGARSPDGPHTHLLPEYLATGRVLPLGMDLPRVYLPGAIFYPKS